MGRARSRNRLNATVWLLLLLAVAALGLYAGFWWPEITATLVLLALVAVWLSAERLTGRWWY